MDIKCNKNPYFYNQPPRNEARAFCGCQKIASKSVGLCADIYEKRPVAKKSATGLFSRAKASFNSVRNCFGTEGNYIENLKHTYDHKVIYGLVEKENYGRNSTNTLTHDTDKLIMYAFGFRKSFVTKFHRAHSAHHTESGKDINLRSIVCDIIASSPVFKPEKKLSVKEHFESSKELQAISGLKEELEKSDYGEKIFETVLAKRDRQFKGVKGAAMLGVKLTSFVILGILRPFLSLFP